MAWTASPGSRQADGDAALHAVEVERAAELLAAHDLDRRPGAGRHEHLGLYARDLHVRGVGHVGGQRAVGHAEGVGVELTALEALADDVDDAVEGDCHRHPRAWSS